MPESAKVTGSVPIYKVSGTGNKVQIRNSSNKLNATMQLFGLPYQFLPSVDQRVPGYSNVIGRKYAENVIMDGTVVTVIPGKPKYLPGVKDKAAFTNALISAGNGNFKELRSLINENTSEIRLYDFQSDYINIYTRINAMCRAAAGFMELNDSESYQINGKPVNFLKYDWKDYRWDGQDYGTVAGNVYKNAKKAGKSALAKIAAAGNSAVKKLTGGAIDFSDPISNMSTEKLDSLEVTLTNKNYMQFYCEADGSHGSDSLSNQSEASTFKQMFDTGSSAMRNIAFMAGSGGIDAENLQKLGGSAVNELGNIFGQQNMAGGVGGTVSSLVGRLLNAGKSVIKGENIIMPDIYGGSSNSKSYTLTMKYRALYGNRLSVYTDVIVPMLHWLALAYPVATGGNSYGSPPLVKVYKPGDWTCNMGLITSIQISKDEVQEAWSMDGLCTEISISVEIADLYSDLTVSPADPTLFAVNSSLIEYLATTCGLDLAKPQLKNKSKMIFNSYVDFVKDLPSTATGRAFEKFDNLVQSFTGL